MASTFKNSVTGRIGTESRRVYIAPGATTTISSPTSTTSCRAISSTMCAGGCWRSRGSRRCFTILPISHRGRWSGSRVSHVWTGRHGECELRELFSAYPWPSPHHVVRPLVSHTRSVHPITTIRKHVENRTS